MNKKIKIKRDICGDAHQLQRLYRVYLGRKLLFVATARPHLILTSEPRRFASVEVIIPVYYSQEDMFLSLLGYIERDYRNARLYYISLSSDVYQTYSCLKSMGYALVRDQFDCLTYAVAPLDTDAI